jgi:hypothetical protein
MQEPLTVLNPLPIIARSFATDKTGGAGFHLPKPAGQP